MVRILFFRSCLSGQASPTAVKPGENLLINASFEAEQDGLAFWIRAVNVSSSRTGGPGNPACWCSATQKARRVRSTVASMASGSSPARRPDERYHQDGASEPHCGVIIHDNGWHKERHQVVPENTNGWQHVEQTLNWGRARTTSRVAIRHRLRWRIQITQVKLEAISAGALARVRRRGSSPSRRGPGSYDAAAAQRDPFQPQAHLPFLRQDRTCPRQYDFVSTIDGNKVRQRLAPAEYPGSVYLAAGDHRLDVAIVERASQPKCSHLARDR